MSAETFVQKMHTSNNRLSTRPSRSSLSSEKGRMDCQRGYLGHTSFPVRLVPPVSSAPQPISRHEKEENSLEVEALMMESIHRRQLRSSPQHNESFSTNTSRSTGPGNGNGDTPTCKSRSVIESGLVRQTSGSTDTLTRLSRRQSLGSVGTHRTESSSGRRTSRNPGWVARHVTAQASDAQKHHWDNAQDRASRLTQRKLDDDAVHYISRIDHQPDSPVRVGNGSPKVLLAMDRVLHDQHGFNASPRNTLVVSPRNKPVPVEKTGADFRSGAVTQSGPAPTTVVAVQNNRDCKSQQEMHPEDDSPSESHHTPRSDLKVSQDEGGKSLNCLGKKPNEVQGLTKEALQLVLKLKEDEEIRQLRQRAITRWLNHLPKPSAEIMEKAANVKESDSSDRTSSESSKTLVESDCTCDGRKEVPCLPPKEDMVNLAFIGKTLEPVPGHPVECPSVHDEIEVATTNEGEKDIAGDFPKPEFEFYNSVDEENLRAELINSKDNTIVMDMPKPWSGNGIRVKQSSPDIDAMMEGSGALMQELGAIPEGASDGEDNSARCTEDEPKRESTVVPAFENLVHDKLGKETEPTGQHMMAARRWTMTLSSINDPPSARNDSCPELEDSPERHPEPDIEIAIDVQEMLNSSKDTYARETFTGTDLTAYEASPQVLDKKGRRLSWYSSEDCESSRIAVGLNLGDSSKSCGSDNRTPTYQSPRSTYSEEFGLKFHVKYTIPEDAVVTEKKSEKEGEVNRHLSSKRGIESDPLKSLSRVSPPVPKLSTWTGTNFSPSGSIADDSRPDSRGEDDDRRQEVPRDCSSPLYDNVEVSSEPPEGTYWLPEFCQRAALDVQTSLDNTETKSEEPDAWHLNPLSNPGENRSGLAAARVSPRRKSSRTTVNKMSSQSQWNEAHISGESDAWGWSSKVSERVQSSNSAKSNWRLFRSLSKRLSPIPRKKCLRILSILPGITGCCKDPTGGKKKSGSASGRVYAETKTRK